MKRKASLSQYILSIGAFSINAWYERFFNPSSCKARVRKSIPIKTNVMLMEQTKIYFQVPSSDRIFRLW